MPRDKARDKARVTVLLSGNGSNLAALLARAAAPDASFAITHVISDRADAYGLTRAREANVPGEAIPPKHYADKTAWQSALREAVSATGPDLVVLAGFMRVLDEAFVEAFAGRLVNIHPSLLPKYRGLNTYARALEAGDAEHGTSVHYVTAELDGGPVIARTVVPIEQDDTVESLRARTQAAEYELYPRIVQKICAGQITPARVAEG